VKVSNVPPIQLVALMAIASTLPPTAKWVAVVIASHLNRETGEAFPSDACIARESGYSERTVRDAVHMILDAGILKATRGGSLRGGKRQSTRYRLGTPEAVSGVDPGKTFPGQATTPEPPSKDPGTSFHQTPEGASGKPMNVTNELNQGVGRLLDEIPCPACSKVGLLKQSQGRNGHPPGFWCRRPGGCGFNFPLDYAPIVSLMTSGAREALLAMQTQTAPDPFDVAFNNAKEGGLILRRSA